LFKALRTAPRFPLSQLLMPYKNPFFLIELFKDLK
jgi:hypothetical protein